jgi:glycosyltransferase involved in cell wall biosynthesis
MARVLHLVEEHPDFQTRRSVDALLATAGSTSEVVPRLPPTVGRLRRAAIGAADVVHAWGLRALAAAVLGARHRVVFSPVEFPTPRAVRWLRAVVAYRDVQVVCATSTQRRAYVERGVPLDRCHLVRPGVDFKRVRRRRDAELRRALGFSDADHVVLAAGESTRAAAHEDALQAVAIAHFLDPRYRMLLWGRGERAPAVERKAGRIVGSQVLSVAERRLARPVEFEELLPAADSVLVAARGPVSTLPVAVCMAAALPIVSTVTYTVAELLEDRHTALMVPAPRAGASNVSRLIARRMLELRDDPSAQWAIADMARTEAYEYFSLTRFLDQYRALYRQVADGQKVEVPEPAPGAGRRFHGRA